MYNRCYFSKGNFETMREKLEEYVAQHKVVSREDVIDNVFFVNKRGIKMTMNNRQLGFIVRYSERQGGVTSFVHRRNKEHHYYLTTVDNMKQFVGDDWIGRRK
tara:strand:- start:6 stop:314 length:309 start_codon:yes stop_codon:yes gene_type:complete